MSGDRSARIKGDGSREGLEFRVIGFEYNRGIERSRIRNASTILRAVVIRVHWSGQMQGGECVKCSLIWVKWGRVHRVAGIVCNAARERGYTVLEGYLWIGWRWKEKVREKSVRREGENTILYEYTTIHPAYYFLYRPILGCGTGYSCGYRYFVLGDFIC